MNEWQAITPSSAALFGQQVVGAGLDDPQAFHRGLQKALSSGSVIDTSLTDGPATPITALRLEDLSGILTLLTHSMKHIVFWKWLKKGGAFNITYQWNQINEYGNEEASPFYLEGGKPIPQDDVYERKLRDIKFLGVEREITLAALLQRTGGGVPDLKSMTTKTGTLHLLQKLEKNLFYGREELDTTNLAFDGLEQQILDNSPAENIRDLEGDILTPGELDEGSQTLIDNYVEDFEQVGFFCSTDTVNNFSKPYRNETRERIMLNAQKNGIVVAGNAVQGYTSQFGFVPFSPSVFMGRFREKVRLSHYLTATGGANAPNPIPAASILVTPAPNTLSKLPADEYWYSIVSKNRFGTSTPITTASGTTIGAGAQLTIDWSAPAATPPGGDPVSYYLFRHNSDPSGDEGNVKLVRELTASSLQYVDINQWVPGTGVAFMLDGAMQSLCAVQLSPLMRFPLSIVTTAYRYLLLLFVDLAVRNPNKMVMYKNVGETTP